MKVTRESLARMGLTEEQQAAVLVAYGEDMRAGEEEAKASRARYEQERGAFEAYRRANEERWAEAEKRRLYRALLAREGVAEKRRDAVLRATDFSGVRVRDGKLEDEEALASAIREEWQDFIGQTVTRGAKVETPPQGGAAVTRAGILSLQDAGERQAAIARHRELFGI